MCSLATNVHRASKLLLHRHSYQSTPIAFQQRGSCTLELPVYNYTTACYKARSMSLGTNHQVAPLPMIYSHITKLYRS